MSIATQNGHILRALVQGDALTPQDALVRFSCMRLSARIYDLKADGHAIESERVEVSPGTWVAQYSMTPEARAKARKVMA